MNNKSTFSHGLSLLFRMVIIDIGCFLMSLFIFTISSNAWLRAIIQLLDLVLVVSMVYSYVYKIGTADSVLVNTGYTAERKERGFIIGLIADAPFIICALLLLLERLGAFSLNVYNYYKIINAFYFPFLYTIMPVDMTIAEITLFDLALALCTVIIIPLLSGFTYLIGLARFSFKEAVFYKKIDE